MRKIKDLIQILDLQPHPEGGYFREVYRSKGVISNSELPAAFKGDRNYSTSIYFMLTEDSFSAFHKINQDETWHFYEGSSIMLHMISPEGDHREISIGSDIKNGDVFQFTVPAGFWFAAKIKGKNYALVGCTVAPGFDFKDFDLADKAAMTTSFPQHKKLIEQFTRT